MTSPAAPLEAQIAQWREAVSSHHAAGSPQPAAIEAQLRAHLAALSAAGLSHDEAFLIALKRAGNGDAPTHAFATAHAAQLWQQPPSDSGTATVPTRTAPAELRVVLAFATAAALAVKAPVLFGIPLLPDTEPPLFYLRNASLFVFPLLAAYLMWQRAANARKTLTLALAFAVGGYFANAYPFADSSHTAVLAILHLPITLWLAVGFAHVRGPWLGAGRMHFVRFSGELAIYCVLIALGGIVLAGFTSLMFTAIDTNSDWFVAGWLIPCGAAGTVIIAAWLVDSKQSVIGNLAPMLTRLFTPLFTILLLVFLATMLWTGSPINVERELLIGLDLLLAVFVGLVLYGASARASHAPPGFFDGLQLLLVASALAVDGIALWAILARISSFGFTPNRVAALGENLILLANLAGSAWLYWRFLFQRSSFATLENWQLTFLPVYSGWALVVAAIFPPFYNFI